MATPLCNFRLPPALLERVDAARGNETRTAFLIRALEDALVRDDELPPDVAGAAASVSQALAAAERRAASSAVAKAGVRPR